jgi:CRP-like cAMP-binding protein
MTDKVQMTGCFINGPLSAEHLFCGLSKRSLENFNRIRQRRFVSEGASLVSRGAIPTEIGILCSGSAFLCVPSRQGPEVLREVSKNELFGVAEALSNTPFGYDVIAAGPCFADYLVAEAFLRFLRSEPEFCFRLLRDLGTNLHNSYAEFATIGR